MNNCKAFITGLSGLVLTESEKEFIVSHRPWGFILFARNITDAHQLSALTDSIREVSGRANVPIFIDQEGGRVQRLRPPLAPDYPSAAELGALYKEDSEAGLRAAWLMSRLHAFDLARFGINANCLPLLDVPVEGSHDVIGARAYGHDPQVVTAMGQAAALGLQAGGILAVMKHIPGHGRAMSDTHKELARVSASLDILHATDFVPFKALSMLPCAMMAHVIYEAVDREKPATLSEKVINAIIREELGFDGLLMTDDLSMKALSGDIGSLAHCALLAGCDLVLHCNGDMTEMMAVAENSPLLSGKSLDRTLKAGAWAAETADQSDETALRAEFRALLPSAVI